MRGLGARGKWRERLAGQVTSSGNASLDVDVDEKHERRRVASLSVSSVFKNSNKLTLEQFLVNYSLHFRFRFLELLFAPKFIQSCLKYLSRLSMHNIITVSYTHLTLPTNREV